ncbi:MAG: SIR2 family protein [Eubacteriales bacterium]
MDNSIENKLATLIESFQQLPYLFVGTGLSMRYANAPSWLSLLYETWKICNSSGTELQFQKFCQGIVYSLNCETTNLTNDEKEFLSNPSIATKIEQQFCSKYYNDDGFDLLIFSENENKDIILNHYNPYKYYVSKIIANTTIDNTASEYRELTSLSKIQNKIAGIITTNYDNILENIFPDFTTMIGQDNLLISHSFNIFEIYKIHGSVNLPNSIIITKEDYSNFDKKLKYLSAKLLTTFVEHPIIFIGYSLGDINIRNILTEIAECLTKQQLDQMKYNFIFITPCNNSQEEYSIQEKEFGNNRIIMHEFKLHDYSFLYDNLKNIRSSMPIKLARSLQDMVCDYVYSASAKNTVIFGDINSPDIDNTKAAVFFGKSDTISQMGFSYYTLDTILEDILFDNKPYLTHRKLIEETFKTIRSSAGATLLPIYKYVKALNYALSEIPNNYFIVEDYSSVTPTSSDYKSHIKTNKHYSSISEIEHDFPSHIPRQVAHIKKYAENIKTEELGDYLRKYYSTEIYLKHCSLFRKLIALYDYKKYAIT